MSPTAVKKSVAREYLEALVTAVVLALFALLNAMDGVCCPDGLHPRATALTIRTGPIESLECLTPSEFY